MKERIVAPPQAPPTSCPLTSIAVAERLAIVPDITVHPCSAGSEQHNRICFGRPPAGVIGEDEKVRVGHYALRHSLATFLVGACRDVNTVQSPPAAVMCRPH